MQHEQKSARSSLLISKTPTLVPDHDFAGIVKLLFFVTLFVILIVTLFMALFSPVFNCLTNRSKQRLKMLLLFGQWTLPTFHILHFTSNSQSATFHRRTEGQKSLSAHPLGSPTGLRLILRAIRTLLKVKSRSQLTSSS